MKKKGLSYEEKRNRLLNIFHENVIYLSKQEVFNLHELEKLGVKKGIVFNMIKDVLTSLMSDDLVE